MIVFSNPLQQDRLRMAYNNDVIRFYSDNPVDFDYCELILHGIDAIAPRVVVNLYPNPQGHFYFNFKPYVIALINTGNFEDTLQPQLNGNDNSSYIHNVSQGLFLQKTVTLTYKKNNGEPAGEDGLYVLDWIAGAEQFNDRHYFSKNDYFVLSPLKKNSGTHYYLKYWEGYPFDIAIYSKEEKVHLYNATNLLGAQFTVPLPPRVTPSFNMPGMPGPVSRLFFSDGRVNETIEDVLPLVEGYNKVWLKKSTTALRSDKQLFIEKIPYQCGVYLKWLNKYGGYSYWLFENTYAIDRATRQMGELEKDNENLENAFGRTLQIGKESQDSIKVIAELLTEDERTIVEGLLDSPKIYLFTGQPFARNDHRDWVEVALKTTGARLKNFRQPLTNFAFDLELPMRYTQML